MNPTKEATVSQILNLIESKRESIVSDTAQLLSFKTISSTEGELSADAREEFRKGFDFLRQISENMGFTFRLLDNCVGIIEMPASANPAETIGVLLHIDVMPPGETEWKYGAFDGVVAEGRIWGRGAQDDKGPIVAMLYAMWAAREAAAQNGIRRACRLIIGTQEETGNWSDIHYYKEHEGAPNFSLVPDAEFPIIIAEKGMVNIQISEAWDEKPTSTLIAASLVSATAGIRANMVPDRATLVLEPLSDSTRRLLNDEIAQFLQKYPETRLQVIDKDTTIVIEFSGKPAHGSRPFEGHNAAVDALRFIDWVEMEPLQFLEFISFSALAGEDIWGEALGVFSEHDFVGKTTVCLGLMKIEARGGFVTYNIRNTSGVTVDMIEKRINGVLESIKQATGCAFEMKRTSSGTNPLFVDPKEFKQYIEPLQYAYQTVTGKEPALKAIGGTTFAKAFPCAVSFGPVLMEEEQEMAHQVNEHVSIENQMRNTKIYALALWGLISTDKS